MKLVFSNKFACIISAHQIDDINRFVCIQIDAENRIKFIAGGFVSKLWLTSASLRFNRMKIDIYLWLVICDLLQLHGICDLD